MRISCGLDIKREVSVKLDVGGRCRRVEELDEERRLSSSDDARVSRRTLPNEPDRLVSHARVFLSGLWRAVEGSSSTKKMGKKETLSSTFGSSFLRFNLLELEVYVVWGQLGASVQVFCFATGEVCSIFSSYRLVLFPLPSSFSLTPFPYLSGLNSESEISTIDSSTPTDLPERVSYA